MFKAFFIQNMDIFITSPLKCMLRYSSEVPQLCASNECPGHMFFCGENIHLDIFFYLELCIPKKRSQVKQNCCVR